MRPGSSTVAVIRFRCSLRLDCGDCGLTRTVTVYEAAKIGGAGLLERRARRLKCARCGRKAARLMGAAGASRINSTLTSIGVRIWTCFAAS